MAVDPTPAAVPYFERLKVRLLKVADADPAAALFTSADSDLLLSFLWLFDRSGWLPPTSDEQRRALMAYDVAMHSADGRTFYEFRSRGGRDDREPPLTLFFHLHRPSGIVRIIGYYLTEQLSQDRAGVLDVMSARAELVDTTMERGQ